MAKVVLKFNTDGENSFNLDDGDIVGLDSLSQSTVNASDINYGCVANTGSLSIVDYNGNIANMIESGVLPSSNIKMDIEFNGNKIQSHITTDSSYDENTKTLDLSLSNTIKDLSTRMFGGYKYPNEPRTAYDLLYYVMNEWFGRELDEETEFKPMLSDEVFYNGSTNHTEIYYYLQYIKINYPVIEANQTFEAVFNQICTVAQLQMFIDKDGNFKFVSNRPVVELGKIIHIPLRNVSSEIKKDVFVKNKFEGVEISENSVSNETYFTDEAYNYELSVESVNYENMNGVFYDSSYTDYGTFGTAKIEMFYTDGSFTVPKKSNNNLTKILSVIKTGDIDSDGFYNVVFKTSEQGYRFTGSLKNESKFLEDIKPYNKTSVFATTNYSTQCNFVKEEANRIYKIPKESQVTDLYFGNEHLFVSGTDNSFVKLKEYDDYYECKFHILTQTVQYNGFVLPSGSKIMFIYKYLADLVSIHIGGNKQNIEFSDNSVLFKSVEAPRNIVKLQSSFLIQDNATLGSKNISKEISDNILLDYANGVRTAKLTVIPVDYYDISGNKVINGNIGELIQVGDIVEVEGQKNKDGELIKWRVTGSNFKYDGEPLQELELMEIITLKDTRLAYFPTVSGLGYRVNAYNSTISGSLKLGGKYDDGEHGLMDVLAISENGFAGCANITDVIINEPIQTLFSRSFANSGITTVTFNTALNSGTGDNAFEQCKNLTKAYLLGGLYGIGYYAFIGCSNLKEVYIGKNVKHISDYAFAECTSLTDVYYEGSEEDWKNMTYKSQTGNNLLYNATFHFNYAMR